MGKDLKNGFVTSQEKRVPLKMVGEIRCTPLGELVMPPMKPRKPNTKNWKRMTPKRREILRQYKEDLERYERDMENYLKYPTVNEFPPTHLLSTIRKEREHAKKLAEEEAYFESLRKKARQKKKVLKMEPQTTLDGIVRYVPPLRTVDIDIITSFGEKPNFLLEREWLLHILNGEKLSETAKQLITDRREKWRAIRGF